MPSADKKYTYQSVPGYAEEGLAFSIAPIYREVKLQTREDTYLISSNVALVKFVYRYGYKTDKNGKWQRFEFECSSTNQCSPVDGSNWLRLELGGNVTKDFIVRADYHSRSR